MLTPVNMTSSPRARGSPRNSLHTSPVTRGLAPHVILFISLENQDREKGRLACAARSVFVSDGIESVLREHMGIRIALYLRPLALLIGNAWSFLGLTARTQQRPNPRGDERNPAGLGR
jgi:hypothetical protein